MSERVHRFSCPFYNRLVSPKSTSALILSRRLTQVAYKVIFVFHTIATHVCQLPAPMLPAHLLTSSTRSPLYLPLCHSFQTRCGFLEYILA
ncbi:unnamed protein product [Hymenolepis diminuta]|uniref:Uncharacterized protein n=1 Tax=Hymenolepis diminuta TaxID=6216 RepID=A0A564YP36_HYMDI|nr:unnamed protein product [Hymenolepis diminuta]